MPVEDTVLVEIVIDDVLVKVDGVRVGLSVGVTVNVDGVSVLLGVGVSVDRVAVPVVVTVV